MPIFHRDLVQGSEEWRAARCGLLTASEMEKIITPSKLQFANNATSRAHLHELAAQCITGHVEDSFQSDDMLRGHDDESFAREAYSKAYGPVEQVGFVTNDKWGFVIGCSPDFLVGEDGGAETKSRKQKYQLETIVSGIVPDEFKIQIQTGLLVTERKWWDFNSYCGGLPMLTIRVLPDQEIQEAIIDAARNFYEKLSSVISDYYRRLGNKEFRLVQTERRTFGDIKT
ncbi:lambda exonuclease family protein [Zavarzinella formosa]|uniref:lambda exonuclease family protein n=1 Tax=Zavarzinella formosa TaxID=360055 RepID=UPI000362F290|nr:lambda exonuclease family protein [Zavarzinella formosa]